MNGVLPTETAIHLAVLADVDPAGVNTVSAVLAYDDRGRRHLHHVTATPSAEELARLIGGGAPAQLQLPVVDGLPSPSSSGPSWRTWVLPSVPPALRTLPPDKLAAALADQLLTGTAS